MLKLTTILHPTDYSSASNYAFRLACSLASDHEARLTIVHVVETLSAELVTFGEAATALQPEAYRAKLWSELRGLQSPDPMITVEHKLEEGDPVDQILRVASEIGAELIVMGTHGYTGVKRLLMGSVAEHVMRKAQCPVLTVKDPQAVSH